MSDHDMAFDYAQSYARTLERSYGLLAQITERNGNAEHEWYEMEESLTDSLQNDALEISADAKLDTDGSVSVGDVRVLLTFGGPNLWAVFHSDTSAYLECYWGSDKATVGLSADTAARMYDVLGLWQFDEFDGGTVAPRGRY